MSSDDIQRVKDAIDPIAFISTFTPLTRRGNRYWGLSPFTNEKTPSFTVRPDGLFYCFSTGVGGDIFRFIELKEGLSFREALERAAEFAGVALTKQTAGQQALDNKAAGFEMLQTAATYFARLLLESSKAEAARSALREREFSEDIWRQFGLGYAWGSEDDWTNLVRKKGWSLELSRQVGLTQPYQNLDRWRHRLMFPILDSRGQTAGFGGRRLNENETAKYINSADSQWFHKGQLLFAYTRAQPVWREKRCAILCEGYTDVIRLHSAGFAEAVAPLGTALTAQQAARVAAHAQTIYLAFDADSAGAKAALNAWSLLVQRGAKIILLEFPAGEDPDSFVRKFGAGAFADLLQRASEFWPQFLERHIRHASDLSQKRKVIEQITEKLAGFQDIVLAELLADELANAAGVSHTSLRTTLARLRHPQNQRTPNLPSSRAQLAPLEEKLAIYLSNHPEQRFELANTLADLEIHPWLNNLLAGRLNSDAGFREWLGRIAHQELPPEPITVLLAGVRQLAQKRSRERRIAELSQKEHDLRNAGDEEGANAIRAELAKLVVSPA